MTDRSNETARLVPGQRITSSGFPGTVVRLYSDGPCEGARMYEIRLPGGLTAVCGAHIVPEPPATEYRDKRTRRRSHMLARLAR